MRSGRIWLAVALLADLLGATGALIAVGRSWQRVVVGRQPPLADAVVHLTGRDLEGAISGFAYIALAGVVAMAATRGFGRRLVGAALAISGAVIIWSTVTALRPVSPGRARASVPSGVGVDANSRTHAAVSTGWPVVALVAGLLIVLAGVLTLVFARRWSQMAARYDAPTAAARREIQADGGVNDIALWSALDRGDDPTARTEP